LEIKNIDIVYMSEDKDFARLKRIHAQRQYEHLMDKEWKEKRGGLSYQQKINLADKILKKKAFSPVTNMGVIRRFKDSIKNQKEVVQHQKKASEEAARAVAGEKKKTENMETALRTARMDAEIRMRRAKNNLVKAPVISSGEHKENHEEIPTARVIAPATKQTKSPFATCFGKWCSKDDALGGGRRRTTRKRRRRQKRKTRKKRTYRSKTRRRKKRTKRKTRKRRR